MKLARTDRTLIAWMLYFSVLFAALACSIGHGQMAGLQLSGLAGGYCAFDGAAGAEPAGGLVAVNPATGSGCALSSSFGALLLAAFFGLLGLLAGARQAPAPAAPVARTPRYLWPSANPRASPSLA